MPPPHHVIKPVLLWTHRDNVGRLPLALDGFRTERPGPDWVPVVIVPLMSISDHDDLEGHAAEFETDGIKIHVNVVASKAAEKLRKARRRHPSPP